MNITRGYVMTVCNQYGANKRYNFLPISIAFVYSLSISLQTLTFLLSFLLIAREFSDKSCD